MTLEETPTIVTPAGVAGLSFADEADTVNALIPKLRARGVEAVVVLIHQGGFQTNSSNIDACVGGLAGNPITNIVNRLDDEVDLVISGHTHAAYNCLLPNSVGRQIPVTGANAFGRVLSNIDMTIESSTGEVTGVVVDNVVVERNAPGIVPNPQIASIVANYSALVSPIANQVIGSITQDVSNVRSAACEIPAGDLIADAQLEATSPPASGGAQLALMNPGGVRASGFVFAQISGGELSGDVTYGEAFTVQPFGNSMVTISLSSQQIKNLLEQQFAGCNGQTVNRVLQPSNGFRFSWDFTRAACDKIRDVSLDTPAGTQNIVQAGVVESPQGLYRVAVNSFLAAGGDNFTTLLGGASPLGGPQDIDALVAYFAQFKTPNPAYDPTDPGLGKPRIQRLDGGAACP
jgi:5'-nucleotidase